MMGKLNMPVKGLIFDYGATIDSNGVHWAQIIWQGYNCMPSFCSYEEFRQAYVYAERALAVTPHIHREHNFLDLMRIKIAIEISFLRDELHKETGAEAIEIIAQYCYRYAKDCTQRALPLLESFARKYPLVLVSNFYGNIESVLSDFNLLHLFQSRIIESAVVGVRKPDPEIFAMGVRLLGCDSEQAVVIGDSYSKDIQPALLLGCQTVWLKGKGWDSKEDDIQHDFTIADFGELSALL